VKNLALGAHLLAAAALSLSVALSALAQSAGTQLSSQSSQAQPPSSQNPPAQAPSEQNVEELSRKLVELEKEVQTLRQSIKRLEEEQKRKQLEEQQKREARQAPQPSSTQPPGAAGSQGSGRRRRPISGIAKQETISRDRETVARIDNQPLDPELIGFFNIPGTKAKVKIDGYAKLDVMVDPRPAGAPDEFINTTFPVNLAPPQKVVMSNVSFRESRINLDFRSPFKDEEFRFYAEIDFFGPDGPTDPRLRHLYGQIKNVLAGHTWSTFSDPDIIPDTLDSARPASIIKTRQAQFRYTQPVGEHHSFAFSVERPRVRGPDLAPDISFICSDVINGLSPSDVERLRLRGLVLEPDRRLICSDVFSGFSRSEVERLRFRGSDIAPGRRLILASVIRGFLRSDVGRLRFRGSDIAPGRGLIRASVIRGFLRSDGEALLPLDDDTPDEGPYNPAPDFVARYRYERQRGHLQFGSLYRGLGFRNVIDEDKGFGWGLNFSAGVLVGKRDNLLLSATYGKGIARYLNNLSDLDLDFDLDNDGDGITALPVTGAYGAYQHYWTSRLRSTVTFGYDRVQNTAFQPDDAFSKSYYTSANLIWRPLKEYHFTVGAEFLYGWQVLKDDSKGRANRVQFSLQYNLYRKPVIPERKSMGDGVRLSNERKNEK
jgi:hypothetical protein